MKKFAVIFFLITSLSHCNYDDNWNSEYKNAFIYSFVAGIASEVYLRLSDSKLGTRLLLIGATPTVFAANGKLIELKENSALVLNIISKSTFDVKNYCKFSVSGYLSGMLSAYLCCESFKKTV
ncbi:hypothetical protein A3F66_06195 [candidate division TM6 bacterium RIFCSPHIGHO2_12_FULL_32_22]|nr:MAG: hypothetical protein A3F66_06195 [candidate division TM6 bacterium RIFCSPHIGHO2_12_FULL_32_22]